MPVAAHASEAGKSANAFLKLYELRMEPSLRQARAWFVFEFHPSTTGEVLQTWLAPGHLSAPYRMVTSYWDMAASLVVQGAIPAQMFNDGNTEHFAVYAKLRPFLEEIRKTAKYPDYLRNLEAVVRMHPQSEEQVGIFARYMERQRGLAAEGKQRTSYPAAGAGLSASPVV
jgi:hypothetical protein